MTSLTGKYAVVTGGASGIGLAIATAFAAEGCHVTIADRASEEKLATAASQAKAQARRLDVAHESEVTGLFDTVAKTGGVDILVNCAGILIEKPLLETSAQDLDRKSVV